MPRWFNWTDNLLFGIMSLVAVGLCLFVHFTSYQVEDRALMWASAGGFVAIWAASNFWSWWVDGKKKWEGGKEKGDP